MIKLKNFFHNIFESPKKQINELKVQEAIKKYSNKMNVFINIRNIR